MFAARGALQRRMQRVRQQEEDDANNALSARSGSRADDRGSKADVNADTNANANIPSQVDGGGGEEGEPEADADEVHLIPLQGLHGFQRKYVECSNFARRTLANHWFNSMVMLCISWASLSVGFQTYDALSVSPVLDTLDLVVLSIFILECVVKILAEGLTPWRFFTGPEMRWNTFDFVIILMSLPVWGSNLGGGNIKLLRMLRLLRIMKLVKRIPQLYMIVMGLIGGLKSIGYILLLLMLVFYLYAISGMYAWSSNDQFHFRSVPIAMITLFRMSTLENWANIMNINYFGCDRFSGGYYTQDPAAAEWFQYCNVTALFGENATTSEIESMRMVNSFVATLYFVTFILISAFVMLSLFIGAITMSMTQSMEQMKAAEEEAERKERLEKAHKRAAEAERREREKQLKLKEAEASNGDAGGSGGGEKLSASQKRDRQKMREVLMQTWDDCDLTDILTQGQGDSTTWKGRYLKLANRCTKLVEHPKFSGFVTLVICMAGIMVGLQTSDGIMDAIGDVLTAIDSMILAVFTTECVIKIIAEGLEPWLFFRSGWNTFDFIIVIGSFMGGKGGMLTMLRLLRLLRVLKLVRAFPQLQVIVSALMKGVSSIGYIGLILLLCFYVFGIVGNMLFAKNDPFHFQYLHYAMISLFHCATMDGWSDVLYINYYGCDNYGYTDYRAQGYNCTSEASGFVAVAYFGSFVVLGGMVLITLFIGVVTTSMEEATEEMEAEKRLVKRVEDLRVRKGVEQSMITSYMAVFRMLDLDGSGSVEEAELRIGLAAIGKYPSYDELKEMMDVVDEDGSGQIDIVEFIEFMIHVREKSAAQREKNEVADGAATSPDETTSATALSSPPSPPSPPLLAASAPGAPVDDAEDASNRIRAMSTNGDDTGDESSKLLATREFLPHTDSDLTMQSVTIHDDNSGVLDDDPPTMVEKAATQSPSSTPSATPRTGRKSSSKYKIVPSG